MINTNLQLSDLQFSQVSSFLADSSFLDPHKTLRYNLSLYSRRLSNKQRSPYEVILGTASLQAWLSSTSNPLAILRRPFQLRAISKGLCAHAIDQIRAKDLPAAWILDAYSLRKGSEQKSSIDLLKNLTYQVLRLNAATRDLKTLSLSCQRFQTASSERDWFAVLQQALSECQKMFIVVDLDVISSALDQSSSFSWVDAFSTYFANLADSQAGSNIKVLLLSSGFMSSNSNSDPAVKVIKLATRRTDVRYSRGSNRKRLRQLPSTHRIKSG